MPISYPRTPFEWFVLCIAHILIVFSFASCDWLYRNVVGCIPYMLKLRVNVVRFEASN